MSYTVHLLTGNKQSLHAIHGRPTREPAQKAERTLVVMLHDFPGQKTDNNDMYGDLEATLNENGYHTLRFDFRGCGETGGEEEHFSLTTAYDDLHHVKLWGKEKGYRRFVLVAEGLGAAIAVSAVSRDIQALVLLWPKLDLQKYAAHVNDRLRKADEGAQDYGLLDGHKFGQKLLAELNASDMITPMHDVFMPTMIVHGLKKQETMTPHINLAREHMQASRLEITAFQDAGEKLTELRHKQMMFVHIRQFLEKNL